ncbi:MAG: F0F1 ATP synthase subunit alpha, partial [Clostridiales Family XIII bacterium]|nr:F0F1 ATP synthase subunit alpha [Clostridiales Family XIII bacterium]
AAVNGYLGDIDLDKIKDFEKGLYDFADTHYPKIGDSVKSTGALDKEAEEALKEALTKYKDVFKKEYDAL